MTEFTTALGKVVNVSSSEESEEFSFKENGKLTVKTKFTGYLMGLEKKDTYKVEKNFLILSKNGQDPKKIKILSLSKEKLELEEEGVVLSQKVKVKYKFVKK